MLKKFIFFLLIPYFSYPIDEKSNSEIKDINSKPLDDIPQIVIKDEKDFDNNSPLLYYSPHYNYETGLNTAHARERIILNFLNKQLDQNFNFEDLVRIGNLTSKFTDNDLMQIARLANDMAKESKIHSDHLIAAFFLYPKSFSMQSKQQISFTIKQKILEYVLRDYDTDKVLILKTNFISDLSTKLKYFNIDYIYKILERAQIISNHKGISLEEAIEESQKIESCDPDFVIKEETKIIDIPDTEGLMAITLPKDIAFDIKNDFIGKIPQEINLTIDYLNNTEKYIKSGAELSHCMILSGPPGTGKTSLVQGIAKATNRILIQCSAGSLITKWQGSGSASITKLFDIANKINKPVIVFIDEVDTITTDNGQNSNSVEQRGALVTLLNQLDSLRKSSQIQVFVICATNHYDRIDEALQNRFASKKVEIALPTQNERKIIFSTLLKKIGFQIKDDTLTELAYKTHGFSGRPIFDVVNSAIKNKVKNNKNFSIQSFLDPINIIQSTIKKKETKKYEEDNAKWWQNWGQKIGLAANAVSIIVGAYNIWIAFNRNENRNSNAQAS